MLGQQDIAVQVQHMWKGIEQGVPDTEEPPARRQQRPVGGAEPARENEMVEEAEVLTGQYTGPCGLWGTFYQQKAGQECPAPAFSGDFWEP